MIIDTSAIIAILTDEPERRSFNEAVEKADVCLLSTAGFVEASLVMENGFPLLFKGEDFKRTDIQAAT